MEAEQKAAPEVAIRFLDGPLAEQTISIERLVTMIGRDRQNDIVILDPRVSRRHARLRREGDSWTIENLSQSSFVAIDQQHMGQGQLQHNSVVHLGENISFVFLNGSRSRSNCWRIRESSSWTNLPRGWTPAWIVK